MNDFYVESVHSGETVVYKATHLQSGSIGVGDTRDEAVRKAIEGRDPQKELDISLNQPEIVSLGPFNAVRIWTVPFGEMQTGLWCDECMLSTRVAQTLSYGSGGKEFGKWKSTYCTQCETMTQEDGDA